MELIRIVFVILLVVNALATISMIDKPRKVITRGDACVTVILDAIMILILAWSW